MTDSVFVFAPGERLTDDLTGAPISGATIFFYDAGTTDTKTVYADADLSASIGTSVVTDSLGYPTSDGSTRTLIYVGTAPYKLVIKDADSNTIATHDNIPGAVVSASSVDVSVTAAFPIVTKSLDYTVVAADQNTTFLINCSSGDVTLTLPSATDNNIPNGWKIKVQHAGSANQAIVVVKSGSGQTINEGTKTYGNGSIALALNGEDCEITADGGNWRVSSHTSPFIKMAQGIIPVADRASTSPGSPAQGSFYLLTGTGGSFSTFSAGDIVQRTGTGWINFTPYTDCGWIVFVQDENLYYEYQDSAWVSQAATTSFAGRLKVANQSAMETGTANDTAVTPGTAQYHPSSAKWWGMTTGASTLSASYGMTSITNNGAGDETATLSTVFSSATWCAQFSIRDNSRSDLRISAIAAGSLRTQVNDGTDGSAHTPQNYFWCGFGDQ